MKPATSLPCASVVPKHSLNSSGGDDVTRLIGHPSQRGSIVFQNYKYCDKREGVKPSLVVDNVVRTPTVICAFVVDSTT